MGFIVSLSITLIMIIYTTPVQWNEDRYSGVVALEKLKVVHIEDSEVERRDMSNSFKQTDNLEIVGSTGDADEGLRLVVTHQPDVVILDLELHKSGKDGTYFLISLAELFIPFRPFVLVVTYNTSEAIFTPVRALGADFIYSKTQRDYAPSLVIQFLTNIQESLKAYKYSYGRTVYSPENQRHFVELIDVELNKVGVRRSKGRVYLKEAIHLLYENRDDYKEVIAQRHGVKPKKIEDAMQYAIKRAWNTSPIDDLLEHYTDIIETKNCIPTVKNFVSFYCKKIKGILGG